MNDKCVPVGVIGSGSVPLTLNPTEGEGDLDWSRKTYGVCNVGEGKRGESDVRLLVGVAGDI